MKANEIERETAKVQVALFKWKSQTKKARRYGLFQLTPNGKWERLFPGKAYYKSEAVKVFQSALLDGAFGMRPKTCIKPVRSFGFCDE